MAARAEAEAPGELLRPGVAVKSLPGGMLDPEPPAAIAHELVSLPTGDKALLLHGLLSPGECERIAAASVAVGMQPAALHKAGRDCDRAELENPEISAELWRRARAAVSGEGSPFARLEFSVDDERVFGGDAAGEWTPCGLNSRFRSCRYGPGGHFSPHGDGWVAIPGTETRTFLTFMVYLNDVPAERAGATRFLRFPSDSEDGLEAVTLTPDGRLVGNSALVVHKVQPKTGMAVVFLQCSVLHDGEPVRSGHKAIFRSDVVFERRPGTEVPREGPRHQALLLHRRAERAEAKGDFAEATRLYRAAYKLDPSLEAGMAAA